MERADVVVLEVDLDERLPVVVALVDVDAIEHVPGEVELADVDTPARSRATSRLPSNSRPFQFCSGERPRLRHGLSSKCGAPSSSPLQVVSPAVDRADDVLAALPRPVSMIAWRWRQMFEMSSMPFAVAHERLRVVACRESAVVARRSGTISSWPT